MAGNFYGGMPGKTGIQGPQGIQGPALKFEGKIEWLASNPERPTIPPSGANPVDHSFYICNKIDSENNVLSTFFILKNSVGEWEWVEVLNAMANTPLNISNAELPNTDKSNTFDLYNAWYINSEFNDVNNSLSGLTARVKNTEIILASTAEKDDTVLISDIIGDTDDIKNTEDKINTYQVRTTKISATEDTSDLGEGSILWVYGDTIGGTV